MKYSNTRTFSYASRLLTVLACAVSFQSILSHGKDVGDNPIESSLSLNDGLKIHLKFDDNNGNLAIDSAGNDSWQVLHNPMWTDGKIDGALSFDGVDDSIDLGSDAFTIDQSSAFSIAFWVRTNGSTGSNQCIIKRGAYAYPFWIQLESGHIKTCVRTSKTNYMKSRKKLTVGTWYHVILSYGEGQSKLFINGELDISSTLDNALNVKSSQSTVIGRDGDKGYLNASLDDFRLYNRMLEVSEIADLSGNATTIPEEPIEEPIADFSLSQYGITWSFSEEVPYGQFANGDYWVVGPVEIVGISPKSEEIQGTWTTINDSHPWSGTRTMNGSMLNPSPRNGTAQGYDTEVYRWHPNNGRIYGDGGNYDPELNVALNVSEENPLVIGSGNSLVSTISESHGHRPQIRTAAILTVLRSRPAEGSFRPRYSGGNSTIRFNKSQLNYASLGNLPVLSGTPSVEEVARLISRPWIDHVSNWSGRYIHPHENMPDYGRDMTIDLGRASLLLQLSLSQSEKEKILIPLVQIGIDNYGVIRDGGRKIWAANGGHMSGRFWTIMLAGIVLNDNEMKQVAQKTGDYLYTNGHGAGNPPPDYIHFGEMDQTFFVKQADVDRTRSSSWKPNLQGGNPQPYGTEHIGLAEWGITHAEKPYGDNFEWGTAYRLNSTSISWSGQVLSAKIMNVESLWNHDALFQYMDRFVEIQGSRAFSGSFEREMWNQYRSIYP